MAERLQVLRPASGFTTGIGFYLAGMDEVRGHLRLTVEGMSTEDLSRRAVPGAHSIAALVLHIGEAEWFWMHCVVSGHKLNEEDRRAAYWDVLKDPEGIAKKGYSASFCLAELDKLREQTRKTLASFKDDDLDRIFTFERRGKTSEQSLRWVLHHLLDHEAQHKGQILMLRRMLGLKNPEF